MRAKGFIFSFARVVLLTAVILIAAYFVVEITIRAKGYDPPEYWSKVGQRIGHRLEASVNKKVKMRDLYEQITVLHGKKDFKGARRLAEKAVKVSPDSPLAHSLLANQIESLEGTSEAIEYLEGLGEDIKYDRPIQFHIATLYGKSGDLNKKTEIILNLAEAHPDDPQSQLLAGKHLSRELGDVEGAREYVERSVELDPEFKRGYAALLPLTTDRRKRKEILNKLIEFEPENSNYTGELGWMEYEDGNYERAALFSRSAAEADKRAHNAHLNQALAELRLGKLEKSWETYVAAVAGCIEAGENYPFIGALGDLVDLPVDVEPQYKEQVISLLEQGDLIASQGLSGYLVRYGEDAYVFEGIDLISGDEISLLDFRSKLVFLDIWASWCGPCIAELPNIVDLQKKLGGERFQVVSISIDDEGAEEALQTLIEENGITYPVLYSGEGWEQDAALGYGVEYIPNTWLISPDGKILYHDLRGEEPYEYSKAFLDSNVDGYSEVAIEASSDDGVLEFKVESGVGSSLEVDAIIIVPLNFGEGDRLFVERYHFTGDDGVIESEIEVGAIEDSLGYVFWSIESPLPGVPDPLKKSGMMRIPVE